MRAELIELLKKSHLAENGKLTLRFETTLGDLFEIANTISKTFGVRNEDVKVDVKFEIPLDKVESTPTRETGLTQKKVRAKIKSGEVKFVSLDDRMKYAVSDGVLVIKSGNRKGVFNYEAIKGLFEEFPPEVTVKDAMKIAKDMGIDLSYYDTLMLFDFYAKNVNFDAEIRKRGKIKVLVKTEYPLRQELSRKIGIEKEVIGTPWGRD